MGLFKKKLSIDEILEGIGSLSDEEKAQVKAMLDGESVEETEEVETPEEAPVDNETAGETVEETSEVVDGGNEEVVEEQAVEESVEEPLAEEQPTEPVAEEPIVEETEQVEVAPEVQKQAEEQDDAQTAKIQALEEKVSMLEERLEQALASLDNKDFGLNPAVPEGGGEDHNRMNAVMRGYAGGNASRYL